MKKLLLIVLLFIAFFAKPLAGLSQTNVSGNISANTTWTKANSPYILTGTIGVPAAYTLTIEPGVTVQRNNDYQIIANGPIIAKGTATDSVFFLVVQALARIHQVFIQQPALFF